LAHPYSLNDDELVTKLIDCGIMGLEVYYPEHSQSMVNFYLNLAKKHNLLVTGGSDCHGNAKPKIMIGSIKIPYELVEKLKEAKDKL
jgi:predicted metal-dependent phosphoesterase TrpH